MTFLYRIHRDALMQSPGARVYYEDHADFNEAFDGDNELIRLGDVELLPSRVLFHGDPVQGRLERVLTSSGTGNGADPGAPGDDGQEPRMSMSSPTEQLVEDVAAVYFGAVGATIKRGVEIDDAGERGGATEVVLKGRLGAALHRLNPDLPHDSIEEVVRILSRPPHPTLIQNNRWFHAPSHRRRGGRVLRRQER